MEDYKALFLQLIAHVEQEVIEYKTAENQYDTNKLGKYFSALSNEANLRDVEFAWIVLGVNNDRKVVGTQFLMDETKRIIDTYGNHPSFTMMAAGNEPAGDWVRYCNDWVKAMKQYDPTKL